MDSQLKTSPDKYTYVDFKVEASVKFQEIKYKSSEKEIASVELIEQVLRDFLASGEESIKLKSKDKSYIVEFSRVAIESIIENYYDKEPNHRTTLEGILPTPTLDYINRKISENNSEKEGK